MARPKRLSAELICNAVDTYGNQKEAARALGISPSTVSYYLKAHNYKRRQSMKMLDDLEELGLI